MPTGNPNQGVIDAPGLEGDIVTTNPKQTEVALSEKKKNKQPKQTLADLKQEDYQDTPVREVPLFDPDQPIRKYDNKYIYDNDGNKFNITDKQFAGYDSPVKAQIESNNLINTVEVRPEKQGEYDAIDKGLADLYKTGAFNFGYNPDADAFTIIEKGAQLNEFRNRLTKVNEKIADLSNASLSTDNPMDFSMQTADINKKLEELKTKFTEQENLDTLAKRKADLDRQISEHLIDNGLTPFDPTESKFSTDKKLDKDNPELQKLIQQRDNLKQFISTFSQADEFIKYGKFLETRNFGENVIYGLQSFTKTITSQLRGLGLTNHYLDRYLPLLMPLNPAAYLTLDDNYRDTMSKTWLNVANGIDKIANSWDDKPHRENFLSNLVQGLGSTFGFMASNIGASILTGGESTAGTVATMISGALSNGSDAYYEALQNGHTEEQAKLSGLLNGIAGTSEALGIEGMMTTLDHAAGKEGFKNFFKRVTKEMMLGGLEEGSQESFQKFFGNLVDYAILNDKVDITEGVGDAFKSSFMVGFLMGGAHTTIKKTKDVLLQKYADRQDKIAVLNAIEKYTDDFAAHVTNALKEKLNKESLAPEEEAMVKAYSDQFNATLQEKNLAGADPKAIIDALPDTDISKDMVRKNITDFTKNIPDYLAGEVARIKKLKEAASDPFVHEVFQELKTTTDAIKGGIGQVTNENVDLNAPNFEFKTNIVRQALNSPTKDHALAYYTPETGELHYVLENVADKIKEIREYAPETTVKEIVNRITQHETVHALTENKVASYLNLKETGEPIVGIYLTDADKEDLSSLDNLLNEARKDAEKDENGEYKTYGLTNLSEFLAELKSNNFFRKSLESKPAVKPEFKNLWEQIKYHLFNIANRIFKNNENNINRFNIYKNSDNLLQQADQHADNLISRFKQEDFHSEVQAYAAHTMQQRLNKMSEISNSLLEQEKNKRNIEIPANHEHQFEPKKVVKYEKISYGRNSSNGYEVSSKGDKRFSALNARLNDGRTIEEAYQLDVKGYRKQGNDWKLGKGKPPLTQMSQDELYQKYKALWRQWANENRSIMLGLANHLQEKGITTLTDMFANTPISQARAIAEIINEFNERRAKTQLEDELLGGAINTDTLKDYSFGKELRENIDKIKEVNADNQLVTNEEKEQHREHIHQEFIRNVENALKQAEDAIKERQTANQETTELTTEDKNNLPDNIDVGNSLGSFVNSIRNEDGTQVFRNNSELLAFGKQYVSMGDVQGLIAFEKGLASRLKTDVGNLVTMFEKQTIQNNNQRTYTEDLYAKIKASTKKNVIIVDKTDYNFTVREVTTDSYKNADGIYTSVIGRRALYEVLQQQIKKKTGLNLHFVSIGYFQTDKGTEKFGKFGQTKFNFEDYKRQMLLNGYLAIASDNEQIAIDLKKSTNAANRNFDVADDLTKINNNKWDVVKVLDESKIFQAAMRWIQKDAPELFNRKLTRFIPVNIKGAAEFLGSHTVGELLGNKIEFNSNNKTESNSIKLTKANVYLGILGKYLHQNLFVDNIFPSLDREKQAKRIDAISGEASQAFLSQKLFKELVTKEKGKDAVFLDNGQVMSRDVIVDTKTVPKAVLDYFNGINLGDGAVIVSQEVQNIFNDLNGVHLEKRGYASKSKQVGIDLLHKNAWHIAPPYSPINSYLFYNKIGKIFMDTASKVDNRNIPTVTWQDILDNKTPSESQVVINNMMNDSHIKSTGERALDVGGLSGAMSRTGFLGLIKPDEKEVFEKNAGRIIDNLNTYIKDVSQNPSKYVKELVSFAKSNSFDSSTRRFILQNLDTANNPNPLLGLAYLYSVVDYFLAGRLPEKFFQAMTLRQEGVYATLTPDLGNATNWRGYLIGSKQLTEEEADQYFTKINGEYFLTNGFIASADTGLKKGDDTLNSVIPPAGVHDMRTLKCIGVIYNPYVESVADGKKYAINKNTIVVPNEQFVKNSGKDFDIDQTAVIPIGKNDLLGKMHEIIQRFNGDAKMQDYLAEFVGKINPEKLDNVIIDETYWKKRRDYWQKEIPDIKIDLPYAKMLDMFGKNPDYIRKNYADPVFSEIADDLTIKSQIGIIFNLGILHTAMLELGQKGVELKDGTIIKLKGKLSDQLAVLYEMTHYTLDWKSDFKLLALDFNLMKFFDKFFDVDKNFEDDMSKADIMKLGLKDPAQIVNDMKNQYLMPLRNVIREAKKEDFRLGLLAIERVLKIAKNSLDEGNPFADTFIGKLAAKMTEVSFGTLMPSSERIDNIKKQVKSAIRSNNRYNLAFMQMSSADVKQFANVFNRLVNVPNKRNIVRGSKNIEPLLRKNDKGEILQGKNEGEFLTDHLGITIRSEQNLRQTGFFETIDNLNQLRELQESIRNKHGKESSLGNIYNDYVIGLLTSGISATKDGRIGFMNGKGFNHSTNKINKDEKMNGSLFIVNAQNGIITFEKKTYGNGELISTTEPFTSFKEFVKRNPQMIAVIENEKKYGFISRLFNDFDIQNYYGKIKQSLGSDVAASQYIKEMTEKGVNGQGILTFKNDKGRNYTEAFVKNKFKEFINSDLFSKQTDNNQNLFYALILGVYDPSGNYDFSLAQALGITKEYQALRSSLNFSMAIEGSPLKTITKQTMQTDGVVTEEKMKATDFSSPLALMSESETNTAKEFLDTNLPIIEQIVKDNLNIDLTSVSELANLPEATKISKDAKKINISDPTVTDYRAIVEEVFDQFDSVSDMDKNEYYDTITQSILDYQFRKETEVATGKIPASKAQDFRKIAEDIAKTALKDLNRNNIIFYKAIYGKGLIKQRMLQYFGNRNIIMSPSESIKYMLGGQVQTLDKNELMQSFDIFHPVDKVGAVSGSWISWQILSKFHDYYADKGSQISALQTATVEILEGSNSPIEKDTNTQNFSNISKSAKNSAIIWNIAEGSEKSKLFKNLNIARLKILQDDRGNLYVVEEKDIPDIIDYLETGENTYFSMRKIKRHPEAVQQGIKGIYEYDESKRQDFTWDEWQKHINTKLKNGTLKYLQKSNYLAMWVDNEGKTKLYQLDEKPMLSRKQNLANTKNISEDFQNPFGEKRVLHFLSKEILSAKDKLQPNDNVINRGRNSMALRQVMTALTLRWNMDAFLPQMISEHIADIDNMMEEAQTIADPDLEAEVLTKLMNKRRDYAEQLHKMGNYNKNRLRFTIDDPNRRFMMPKVYHSAEQYMQDLDIILSQEKRQIGSKVVLTKLGNKIATAKQRFETQQKRQKEFFERNKNSDKIMGDKTIPLHKAKNYDLNIENVTNYIGNIAAQMRHDALETRALMNERYLTNENSFIKHEMAFTTSLLLGEDFMWKKLPDGQRLKPNNAIRFVLKANTPVAGWENTSIDEEGNLIPDGSSSKDRMFYGTVLKTEPFYYTVKVLGAPESRDNVIRVNIKTIHSVRTVKGAENIKKLEIQARQLLNGADLGTVKIHDFINALAKFKVTASNYALLNFKPMYSFRNRIGGNLMNHSLFTFDQIRKVGGWISEFKDLKDTNKINNEVKAEYFEMLNNEISAIFGGLNELMGKFGGMLSDFDELLTPDFLKLARTETIKWENTKEELKPLLDILQNKKDEIVTNTKIDTLEKLTLKLKRAYSKNALFNFPFGYFSRRGTITQSTGLFNFSNPKVSEEENRNETVFLTAMACMNCFELNGVNFDDTSREGKAAILLYKQTVKRFILNQTQQNIKNTQFMYRQPLDLSHWDSTVLGKSMVTQFGHYSNSFESAYANRMRNMFRVAEEFGWTQALDMKDGKYNAIFRGKFIEQRTGQTVENAILLPTPIFAYGRQFGKMSAFALLSSMVRRMSNSARLLLLSAGVNVVGQQTYNLINSFFLNNLNSSVASNLMEGLTTGLFALIGAGLSYDPPDKDKKAENYRYKAWRTLFGFSEKDFAKFEKEVLKKKYGNDAALSITPSEYKIEYYTQTMQHVGLPLMFFVPQGVGSGLITDVASEQLAYSLFKTAYQEALVPDAILMQSGSGLIQTIVPFGYMLNPIGKAAYLKFLAGSNMEYKLMKYKQEHKK